MNRKLTIIFSILLTVLTPLTCLSKQKDVNTSLQKQVEQLLEGKNVQVGIAVYYQGKMLCTKNADQSFPMMSVFKLHQAVAILHCLKQDSLTLKKPMLITKDMLSPDTYSPLRDKYPDGDIRLKVSQLIEYSVAQSDNNASNILFNLFDGTHYANQVIQDLGCTNTQIKWTEDEMAMDHSRAYFNSTTPNDAILLLEMLVDNRTQRQQDFLWLTEVMSGTQTGPWGQACACICRTFPHLRSILLTFHPFRSTSLVVYYSCPKNAITFSDSARDFSGNFSHKPAKTEFLNICLSILW